MIVFGGTLLCGALGGEVEVTLSDGTVLKMQEPTDMMGATWAGVGGDLPAAFLIVGTNGLSDDDKLRQLLDTTRGLGSLFGKRYDRAVGATDEYGDLAKIEQILRDDREGKTDPQTSAAVRKGEAVAFWTVMLEDHAKSLGVAPGGNGGATGGLEAARLDEYVRQIRRGEDADVYETAIKAAAKDNRAELAKFIAKASPEDIYLVEKILEKD